MIQAARSHEAGFTLVETLLTVVIVGITFAVFVGGMGTAVLTADYHRKHADARAAIRNFGEAIKAAPYDANCATAATSYAAAFAPTPPTRSSSSAVTNSDTNVLPEVETKRPNARRVNFIALATGATFTPPSGTNELWDAVSGASDPTARVTSTASDQAVPVAGTSPRSTSTSTASGISVTQTITLESATGSANSVAPRLSTHNSATGTTTLDLTKPSNAVVGDTMIAHIALRGGDSTTVTAPTGWTLIAARSNGIATRSLVYQRSATSSAPPTFRWTTSTPTEIAGGIVAYGGVVGLFTASITAFQVWNGVVPATPSTFVNCPVSDNGLQQITLRVVALDTRAEETVVVVKRRP